MMVYGNDGPRAHGGLSVVASAHGGPGLVLAHGGLGTTCMTHDGFAHGSGL